MQSPVMSQTSSSSSRKDRPPLGAPSPHFSPYALYVAIVEKTIPPVDSSDESPPSTQESLELCYRDGVTSAPIGSSRETESGPFLHYWSLLPSKQPKHDTMYIYNALCNKDVLGYLRVADLGDMTSRFLHGVIQADDKKVTLLKTISSEVYVFNVLERFRKHAALEVHMGKWNMENFLAEVDYWRNEWKKQGLQREWNLHRPFADCRLTLFDQRVHY